VKRWQRNLEDVHELLRAAEQHRLTLLGGDQQNIVPGIHGYLGADSHTFEGNLDRVIALHDFERWTRFTPFAEVDGFKIARAG